MYQGTLGDEDQYRACVGDDDKADYYVALFQRFDSDDGRASWNWSPFFLTFFWFVYRGMYGYAAAYLIALPVLLLGFGWLMTLLLGESAGKFFYSSAAFAVYWVALPTFANSIYHGHVQARIEKAAVDAPSPEATRETLSGQRATHPVIAAAAGCAALLLGIAAALGITAYEDRVIRAQVAEGLGVAAPVQTAVERAHATSGEWPADLEAAGLAGADIQGKYVTAIDVLDGMILIYYGNTAHPAIARSALSLRPVLRLGSKVEWQCGYAEATEAAPAYGTNIEDNYLPSECQAASGMFPRSDANELSVDRVRAALKRLRKALPIVGDR